MPLKVSSITFNSYLEYIHRGNIITENCSGYFTALATESDASSVYVLLTTHKEKVKTTQKDSALSHEAQKTTEASIKLTQQLLRQLIQSFPALPQIIHTVYNNHQHGTEAPHCLKWLTKSASEHAYAIEKTPTYQELWDTCLLINENVTQAKIVFPPKMTSATLHILSRHKIPAEKIDYIVSTLKASICQQTLLLEANVEAFEKGEEHAVREKKYNYMPQIKEEIPQKHPSSPKKLLKSVRRSLLSLSIYPAKHSDKSAKTHSNSTQHTQLSPTEEKISTVENTTSQVDASPTTQERVISTHSARLNLTVISSLNPNVNQKGIRIELHPDNYQSINSTVKWIENGNKTLLEHEKTYKYTIYPKSFQNIGELLQVATNSIHAHSPYTKSHASSVNVCSYQQSKTILLGKGITELHEIDTESFKKALKNLPLKEINLFTYYILNAIQDNNPVSLPCAEENCQEILKIIKALLYKESIIASDYISSRSANQLTKICLDLASKEKLEKFEKWLTMLNQSKKIAQLRSEVEKELKIFLPCANNLAYEIHLTTYILFHAILVISKAIRPNDGATPYIQEQLTAPFVSPQVLLVGLPNKKVSADTQTKLWCTPLAIGSIDFDRNLDPNKVSTITKLTRSWFRSPWERNVQIDTPHKVALNHEKSKVSDFLNEILKATEESWPKISKATDLTISFKEFSILWNFINHILLYQADPLTETHDLILPTNFPIKALPAFCAPFTPNKGKGYEFPLQLNASYASIPIKLQNLLPIHENDAKPYAFVQQLITYSIRVLQSNATLERHEQKSAIETLALFQTHELPRKNHLKAIIIKYWATGANDKQDLLSKWCMINTDKNNTKIRGIESSIEDLQTLANEVYENKYNKVASNTNTPSSESTSLSSESPSEKESFNGFIVKKNRHIPDPIRDKRMTDLLSLPMYDFLLDHMSVPFLYLNEGSDETSEETSSSEESWVISNNEQASEENPNIKKRIKWNSA